MLRFLFLFCLSCSFLFAADDITFIADVDGSEQKYVQVIPDGYKPDQPVDVLIALHGHGSDRWQFIRQNRDECRAVRDVAKQYGMILVSPDYRARTSWMGPKAEADLVQIIQDVKARYPVRRVYLTGASMGGASCLTFAALHPHLLDGVASMNGTANHLEYENFQAAIQAFDGYVGQILDALESSPAAENTLVIVTSDHGMPYPGAKWTVRKAGIEVPLIIYQPGTLFSGGKVIAELMSHVDVLGDVLATDVHVMVEKPLCTTVTDCQRVVDAAAAGPAGRVVWMGLEYRYMPPTTALLCSLNPPPPNRSLRQPPS